MEVPYIDPEPLIAPLFLANSLNWLALGVLLVQCCFYLQNFPTDQRWIRILVATIFVLELVQTATTTHQAWWYTVTNWNNPSALLTFPWSAMTVPIMAGIIAAIVQIFYAWRIFVLASNWFLCGMSILVVVLALLQSITSIVVSVMFELNRTPEELLKLQHGFELWITSSFVCDVLIAGNMLFILYTVRNQSIWERASGFVGRLIGITIGTGAAIAICGALTLALFATTVGMSFQYLPAAYIWGKL
ncbi:hypothetical protein L226DRAFT_159496 [Lentinus tigrinus ALCF2SS1-7]|uniref:DUF6534 domain-containing protein n=1 Tax=Lentinus tigrinus ALCF2SS1-6 TaxID=1328759 RepID=A0A5C2S1E4_9APHY|nr:hypothetical protein L227DRAFT_228156 [Lentinus tigrinus ALCF2SS1-6]RPD71984.1 hypothetical protein L226DRAFT_159496 [Lentinus tigrinus ALCF2SS1-7]